MTKDPATPAPTIEELMAQQKAIETQLAKRRESAKGEGIAMVVKAMTLTGLSINELFTAVDAHLLAEAERKAKKKARTPAPAVFRNPNDHSQTWSGKGRTPAWYAELIEDGFTEDMLRIPVDTAAA